MNQICKNQDDTLGVKDYTEGSPLKSDHEG